MLTRRDQVQSYQFLVQRVISALVIRETDPLTPPFRRFIIAGWTSLIVACVLVATVGIFGLLRPGGKESWRQGDKVILERETGAQYIYRNGMLYRVANYTSGVLILGKNHGTVTVLRSSILGVPRGSELGIVGAPDGLPSPNDLLGAPWTLCSRIVSDNSGTKLASTVLIIGSGSDGGSPVGNQGVVTQDIETGHLYLIVNGRRHRIADMRAAMVGLGLSQQPRVQVGTAWLDAVPAGVDLAPPAIPNRGEPSKFPGALVGQLMVSRPPGGASQYYAALTDGLMSVTEVQSDLLLASQATQAAYPDGVPASPREISLSQAATYALPDEPVYSAGMLPKTPPVMSQMVRPDTPMCGSFSGLQSAPEMTINARLPVSDSSMVTARRTHLGTVLADRVMLSPGRGALVDSVQGRNGPGVIQLITEQGIRYPFSSPDLVDVLGYSRSKVVELPAELVARVPQGVPLDPAKAAQVLLQN